MGHKLSELRDLKEMYEKRLKSENLEKRLKNNYQHMLDVINEKIEKNQIFRRYFNQRIEKSEICPAVKKRCYHMTKIKLFNACVILPKISDF